MTKAWDFYNKLKVGIDVDWLKTKPGRTAHKYWTKYGLNIPMIYRDRGFSHVRIRIQDHPKEDPMLLQELDTIVGQCVEVGVVPIVAYQAAGFKYAPNSLRERANLINFWYQVATKLERYGPKVAFNIVIETTGKVMENPEALMLAYQKVNDMLREFSKGRIHIYCPHKISSPESLPDLVLPTVSRNGKLVRDPNVIVESHWYAAGPQEIGRKAWCTGIDGSPTTADLDRITRKVELAAAWRDEHSIPVWVGAWMSGNFAEIISEGKQHDDGAPMCESFTMQQRELFTTCMMRQLRKYDLAHAINSDTKFYNRQTNQWYASQAPILNKILAW